MKIEIYTKDSCSFCNQAKNLFQAKGWEYTEHYINESNRQTLVEELTARLGSAPRTVPQIFVDDVAIGGYTELVAWAKNR